MKRSPITSESLFKGTVVLLGIPAVLLSAITILYCLLRFVSGPKGGGIGGFTFGVTWWEFRIVVALLLLGVFLLVYVLRRALVRRRQQ
ncbi:MAG TPA: hypothetical protein VGN90_18200 [Pyrinomonadaceae bacterium]|jgi:hypothetical protein|nr:hypothetical protein [Pyrinomonadaceae bacterium]